MSKYQIKTIREVMNFSEEQAEHLMSLMDSTGDHPDWSEFSTAQFRRHFALVMAGE